MKHINLTQMLQGCSKRNGMTVRASNPDGEPTVNRQSRLMSLSGKKVEKEQLSPSCLLSASFPLSFRSRYLRYAAMIFCVLAMSVGQMWGATITWNTADNATNEDVNLTSNTGFTGDDGKTTLTYTNPSGCKRLKSNGGLYMNGTSQFNKSTKLRYLTFKAPSTTGTVSLTLAAINGKTNGTGSATIKIYGGTTVAYDVSTLNSSLTSPTIYALQTGTSDIIITFSAKCTIKEVKWTDVAEPSYTTIYANDFTATPMGTATVAYSSMAPMGSSVSSWIGWKQSYAKGVVSSSSNCSATLTFATPLALNSDGNDKGRIRIYWGHSTNNKTLGLKVNGSSVSFSPTTVATTLYPTTLNVAEYTIPDATTNISSIAASGSSSTGTYLFRIEVLTHSAGGGCGSGTQAALTLSSSSGTICGTGTATFTVSGGSGTGALSVSSSDESKATASIDGTTVTVTGVAAGSATITVTKACDATYAEKTATYSATVAATPSAAAGVDKTTEPGTGVALAATAAADGCTGAWTIQSGPNTSTAQLSSTSSATATFTPTVAGTYTLRWTVTNTSSSCSAYDDMTVTAAVCSISDCGNATLTYPIYTSGDLSTSNLFSSATSSNATAVSVGSSPAFTGVTVSSATKGSSASAGACYAKSTALTGKMTYSASSKSSSYYIDFPFTVNTGYTFTPCDVQVVIQPVSSNQAFTVEITDGTNVYGTSTATLNAGVMEPIIGLTSTAEMSAGNYAVRLYPHGGSSKEFRMGANVILKGTTAAVASDAYDIHIGKNNDNYTDESLTNTSGTTWSKTVTLDASSYYEFKVKKTPSVGEAVWYGNNGKITATTSPAWDFSTGDGNCKLYTSVAGSYTFSWDASTNKLTVTYPAGEHPTKRIYMACGSGTWCDATPKFFVHSWGVTVYNTQVQQNACGEYYADIIWYNDYFQFTRNNSTATAYDDQTWNYSQDLTYDSSQLLWTFSGWSGSTGNFSSSAYSPTTYTISYNAGTGGSGTKANESKTCGVDFTLPGSTFTYGGHTQDGWATTDGGTIAYALSGSYTTNDDEEFFPHWKCNTPEISCSSNTITISVPTGATVYYTTTTDGSTPADPTSSSTAYNPSSKPTISADTKIKAIAIQSGCTNSAIASASLTYEATGTRYYLFTPTSAPVHGGVLSGQFVTTGSKQNQEKTILGYTFPSYLNGVGTATTMHNRSAGNQGIQYYAKTSNTKFIIYYGVSSSSGTYSINIGRVSEGETSVTSVSRSVSANDLDTIQYEYTNSKNTTFSFHINNNNIWIYQIVAIESGTDHKQAGEAGYDLSFNKGRIALDNSSPRTITAEGLTIKSSNSFTYTNTTALSFSKNDLSNNQISFTTPASPGDLKLTWSGGQMAYNTSASASGATNITSGTAYSLSGSTTYYLINTGSSSSSVTKLQFVTAATTHSVTVEYNGSGSYGTAAAASTTVGEGSTTTITASPETGYQVNSWEVIGTGSSLSDDGSTHSNTTTLTMGTADATVTCTFGAISYTLAWSSNGGSDLSGSYTSGSTAYGASITAPTDPTLSNYTFDGWKTNNDGTGTTAGATMPAAATTYYAAWKQTVTLKTGAQGSGADQTPYVYINGTGVNSFTAHTATGYTLQGYYTAGSGGVKVLNADGTFAAANVTDYITSSKWSRTGAAPTLFAQWVASEDCSTSDFVIKKGSDTQYQGCMESSSYDGTATSFTAGSATTVGNAKMTISSYSKGAITRPGSGNTFSIVIEPVSGYYLKSICWAGKVESGETVSYYWDDNSGSATTISAQTTSGTGVTYNAPNSTTTKFTASYVDDGVDGGGIWWRNVQVEVCAAGGTTYNVTYDDNGKTGGSVPTDDTDYSYGDAVTVKGNTGSLEKTSYTFAGWTTNNNGTGSSYEAGSTFSITDNTTLYAKWTQAVTLNKNGGSTDGSATAVWNATGLTGITHAKPAAGYKLLGYYSASSDGTKVLNSDGSFAATNVTGYITSGKWSRTSATTLYAEYESAGALTWNLIVNSDTTNLSTSTKTSAFTEISTTNMTNATLAGDLTYEKAKKSALTGKISTPASYDADDYVYVTFQVASGYKFTPSSIKVIAQPVTTGKDVKLSLTDGAYHSLVSSSATSISGGSTQTVTLAGNGTYFTGTVTLKIYCYGATDAYRLGTPITIEGEIEEACATMPSYTSMSYTTTTFAQGADASGSPITIVGGTNIDTYQWKYNTTNDRTSGTECVTDDPTSLVPLTDVASGTTRYYWCEMKNTACDITIKSPAVAITVVAAKSDATVSWTGTTASANYGGGGYTVTATVSTAGWDGTLTEDMLTAMDGVVLSNIAVTNNGKTISANFGVTEGANAEATNVAFYLNHPATTGYNAIDETYNTTTLETSCIGGGGGDGSSYDVRVRKNTTTILQGKSTVYGWDTPTKGFVTQSTGGSVTSTKSGYDDVPVFDSISKTNAKAYWVKSYVANVKKIRVYGQVGDDDLTATGVYHVGSFVAGGSSTAVAYSVIYEDEVDALKKGNHWFEITLDEAISTNDIIYFTVNKNFKIMGVRLTTVGAGGATLATALSAWSPAIDTRKEVYEDAASFIETVTKTGANANTMGAITYSSGDETIATVDNRTGRVTIANSITWGDAITYKDVTITASLAPSGCYQGKTATYTLRVNKLTCTEAAGTITASSEGSHVVIEGDEVKKCTGETVTLTLGGYEEGATSFQWYKDGVLQGDKTTSAITTGDAGVWYAVSNKGCTVTSTNEITITNRSTSVHATRLVKEWYIKHGRLTPDIALWELGDDCSFVSVAASEGWDAGTDLTEEGIFYEQDGIVYMKGTEPKANAGAQQDYTLTLTVNDGCSNQTLGADGKKITIHHQQNTDKHVLAFIVSGTDKGDWTAGVTADQTTNVGLYNAIAANFDVLATNSRSTDDEQKLKEYYSQFDILCITDYPNTGDKGANKKSYVDALGALIDIRPILTMEAWVSKLANWKAKGLSGNPKNPSTRQYTMDLQCKDHEIFAGTHLTKVGEGDEAMYRVSMVCDTLEDYKTLDATYGSGTHAEKDGYNYGGKPALQGFTFTEEMANDLLPIGLIDDGAGNPLQVGIERQRNMEARLMVLGINSYAMERLTVDGEQVVINALNYLMKKNAEDIADCSIYFTGGDADEDESTRNNWNVDSHWSNGTQPISTQKVRILAPCVIPSGVQVHVTDVLIVPDGPINHGADEAHGSLTIEAGGALIVDGKVEETTAPNYFHPHATSAENLVLKTSSSAQAALIFNNEDGDTKATVEMYSLGRKDGGHYQFQYYAVPMDYVSVSESFAGSDIYTYVWHEATGWERRGYYTDLYAFEGVGITTKLAAPKTYTMKGALASTATKEITLTKDDDGYNLIGNSWTAPIQISQLEEDNGSLSNKTVYIYNAGNDSTAADGTGTGAGQWQAIPFDASGFSGWSGMKVIPAMQAFELVPTSEETLTLDYEKVVRGDNQTLSEKLHAPRRVADHAGIELMRIRVADSKTHTDLHLFEGERFSDEFDNGWEAAYMDGDDGTTKLYADVALGRMAVVATDELEGTLLGFAPGKETEYTFTFGGEGMGYYLNDLKLKKSTPISEGETYSFTYEEGDTNRFYISRTRIDAPQTPTGVENTHSGTVKAHKFIYNDKLYIMLNGRVYSAEGQIVK